MCAGGDSAGLSNLSDMTLIMCPSTCWTEEVVIMSQGHEMKLN